MEQGEFLRVAWRVIVAEKVEEGPKSACAKGLGCFYLPSCGRKGLLDSREVLSTLLPGYGGSDEEPRERKGLQSLCSNTERETRSTRGSPR